MAIARRSRRSTELPRTVNRRDFLRLSARGSQHVLELSCERLYMQYVDAESAQGRPPPSGLSDSRHQFWEGEPPAQLDAVTADELFAELERELANADVLCLLGPEWMSKQDFTDKVEACIRKFRARGGRVENGTASA